MRLNEIRARELEQRNRLLARFRKPKKGLVTDPKKVVPPEVVVAPARNETVEKVVEPKRAAKPSVGAASEKTPRKRSGSSRKKADSK